MAGIVSCGAYIPRYRLTGALLADQWGGSPTGRRAVANHDEDALTMAADAALTCLQTAAEYDIGGCYFASTTPPYAEKGNSPFLASVANLSTDIFTSDFCGSLRAGTGALRAARDAVASGSARAVLVAAADMRLAKPGDPEERTLGDGAAALLIGADDGYARIVDIVSTSHEFLDVWRTAGDAFVHTTDAKFVTEKGYVPYVREAVGKLLERNEVKPLEVAHAAVYAPNARVESAIASACGLNGDALTSPHGTIGDAGAAQAILSMIAALEKAAPGEKILVAGYSAGCDAILLEATDKAPELHAAQGVQSQLERGRELSSYAKYLTFRNLVAHDDVNPWTAAPVLWREEKENYRLLAQKCRSCGAIQYPRRRICWKCSAQDAFDDHRLSRRGKVFTFTRDHLVPSPDAPVAMISADLDGGGRFYGQFTDGDAASVSVGMDVELTLRKLHGGGGIANYFWKFRPVP